MANFSFHKQLDHENQLVDAKAEGTASRTDIVGMFESLGDFAGQSGVSRLMLDVTSLELDYDAQDVYHTLLEIKSVLARLSTARVVDLANYKHDLIETFSSQENLKLRNFPTRQEALAWLLDT